MKKWLALLTVLVITLSPLVPQGPLARSQAAAPNVNNDNICDNSAYGIYNSTPSTPVPAENNWWGSESGPYHPALNPGGSGNGVTNGVSFQPWAVAPIE